MYQSMFNFCTKGYVKNILKMEAEKKKKKIKKEEAKLQVKNTSSCIV